MIVGLGNPGPEYEDTRHNIGFWYVDELARRYGACFKMEKKFFGLICRVSIDNRAVLLLKPMTFMNRSGQSVLAVANFYKIPLEQIMVVHDDLDIPLGSVRLKKGGGHGGHNGLRDIAAVFAAKDFLRLRMGIGHPGRREQVTGYVLGRPDEHDRRIFADAVDSACDVLPLLFEDGLQKAMHKLHSHTVNK